MWRILAEMARRIVLAENVLKWNLVREHTDPDVWAKVARTFGFDPALEDAEELGSGTKGTAYALPDGLVLKLTADATEADAMNKITGKSHRTLVSVEKVARWSLRDRQIFAIKQERLQKNLDQDWKDSGELATFYYSQIIGKHFVADGVPQFKAWCSRRLGATPVEAADGTKVPPMKRTRPVREVEKPADYNELFVYEEHDPDRSMHSGKVTVRKGAKMPTEQFFGWFTDLCRELKANGIKFYDLNPGNLMKRGNDFVVTDLGLSVTDSPGTIEEITAWFQRAARTIQAGWYPSELFAELIAYDDGNLKRILSRLGVSSSSELVKIGGGYENGRKVSAHGEVFRVGSKDLAFKITDDEAEARAAYKLMNSPMQEAYFVEDVFRVKGTQTYGIVMELLEAPTDEYFAAAAAFGELDMEFVTPAIKMFKETYGDVWSDEIYKWMFDAAYQFKRRGIVMKDLHAGNVMRRPSTGEHVVIDIGHQSVAPAANIEEAKVQS